MERDDKFPDKNISGRLSADAPEETAGLSLPDGMMLRRDEQGLVLERDGQSMRGDFEHLLPRLKAGRLGSELLVRAARLRGLDHEPVAIDATAGMGEDSLLLAAAGFTVYLFEKDPVIALLLADTLERSAHHPDLAGIVSRMHLTQGDSLEWLPRLQSGLNPDVILLDPMFPARSKSALVRKKFQILHGLERPCEDEEALLAAALAAGAHKIVIKRPLKGPYLAGRRPDYSLSGKAVRYDCIVLA